MMNKLFIAAACVALSASSGFGQGTIDFQNSVATEFYLPFFEGGSLTDSAAVTSADGIDVGLFYSTAAFNTIAGGTLAGIETIGTAAGQLAGNKSFTFGSLQTGDADFYQVFAWDSRYGNSVAGLEACVAAGGLFGASSAGPANTDYAAIGNSIELIAGAPPPAPGTPLFGTSGNVFGRTVLTLTIGPEPTTIAIGGLGAAAMMLFRRRRK
jgi:hypothetical protein